MLFGTGRSQAISRKNPKRGRKKTTSCRVRQEAAPDTDFGASTLVGKMPSDRPDRESTADLFPETALGRKEPRVRQPCSVASVDDRVSICAVRSCAGAM